MGDGRAKEGEQAIPQELDNGATILLDRLADAVVDTGDDLAPVFRIEPFGRGGGADNIGEEHGDELALALTRGGSRQRLAAIGARLPAGEIRMAAIWA